LEIVPPVDAKALAAYHKRGLGRILEPNGAPVSSGRTVTDPDGRQVSLLPRFEIRLTKIDVSAGIERRRFTPPGSENQIPIALTNAIESDLGKDLALSTLELLSNIPAHSEASAGFIASYATNYRGGRPKHLQIAVGDAGVGVARSLERLHGPLDPQTALSDVVTGVRTATGDDGRGRGLHFVSGLVDRLRGDLRLLSGPARLHLKAGEIKTRSCEPISGTLVVLGVRM
jgi:anti-sigma regulatory factor (Ser/Thr protein kinase)